MSESRKLHGFKVLRTIHAKNFTIKLLAQNGSRYIILASNYFLGIPYKHRRYEFSNLEQAEYYCQRVMYVKK